MYRNWQALWEEKIERSSFNHRRKDLSEIERLNILAEATLKAHGSKLNQANLKTEAEFQAELSRLRRFISKDSSVLDIGAGSGRLAIPLAKEVRRLTAIEPADVFMNRLKENARQEKANNFEFVETFWSEFPLKEKYDLVYSTWSLAVRDPESLMKMHKASKGYCAIELGATPSHIWDFFGQIYPLVIGEAFQPTGNYLNILTALYDHNIYANLETWRFEKEIKYERMEEALSNWKALLKYYAYTNEEMDAQLHQFYQSHMNPDGTYTYPVKGFDCMIWWHV